MPNPIYRVIIEYGYRKKGSNKHYQYKLIDTFALTNDVKMIQNSAEIRKKLIRNAKTKHKDLDIVFKSVYVEGQYGQTVY
tara:strand:- start:221 stop:460 length:240 start_codon:yes stop_codon:yes gene_type:complete